MLETNTTQTSAAEFARAGRNEIERRLEEFEPELTAEEIEAQGLVVLVSASGITFYTERAETPAICPACAAGYHEQPALHPCDCICHGQATPRKPADTAARFLAEVEASTLPLRTRRAA
ncbi:MAG: hypothetical protein V4502_08150 [Pseudomonadota bacterium]